MNTRPTPSVVADEGLVERVADALFRVFEEREPPTEYPLQGQWVVAARAALAASDRDVLVEALTNARRYIANCWIDPVADDETQTLLAKIDAALAASPATE